MAVSAPPGAAFSHHGEAEVATAGRLLDRDEVAERLRVSRRTVQRLEAAGHLTVVHVSERSPRITEASVEAHIASHAVRRDAGQTAVSA